MIGFIAIVLLVALTVGLVFYFSPSYAPKILATETGPHDLNSEKTVVDLKSTAPFYAGPQGSFQAFVYMTPAGRTGAHAPCGTNENQPSCTTGEFGPCKCDANTGNCDVCGHAGYQPLLNVAGVAVIEVLNAPDASRQGRAMVQLLVKTVGPSVTTGSTTPQKYIETIPLPEIPLQKWVMITVAKEGRRFDVYYNDRIVHSQQALMMPVSSSSDSNFRGVTSGSAGLGGATALLTVFDRRLSSQDVAGHYSAVTDTRGNPYLNNTSLSMSASDVYGLVPQYGKGMLETLGVSGASFNLCPKGGCFNTPVVRPASPLYDWSSSYA